jgi:DNA-binding NarL/FixJ family response regulator
LHREREKQASVSESQDLELPERADPVSVLICDDQRLFADALAIVVGSAPNVRLVAEPVDNAAAAIATCARLRPEVVLMDLHLPGRPNGIEATKRIRSESPGTKVVIVTADSGDNVILDALESGASGVLRKSESLDRVLDTVKAAARNEWLIDLKQLPRMLESAAREREARREREHRLDQLTEREREILALMQEGARTNQIAERLYISPRTVATHAQNILRKLQVHSKLEAVAFASLADQLSA